MKTVSFFQINESHRGDDDCCFFSVAPQGLEGTCYRLAKGIPFGEPFPANAQWRMQDDEPGMVVPDIVGNTRGLLVVSASARGLIASQQVAETEFFRVAILDHKGRLASDGHVVVNPIGTLDCADLEASSIEWFDGDVVDVDELVLDARKLVAAPALFRPREEPRSYVVRGDLAASLQQANLRNLDLRPLRTLHT